jgi:hypothetical protein
MNLLYLQLYFLVYFFQRFKEALNGLAEAGWPVIESGVDDIFISVNSSLNKVIDCMKLTIMDRF